MGNRDHTMTEPAADIDKIIIPNRDIDDPADNKEIAPVRLDLNFMEEPEEPRPAFEDAIAAAAATARQDQPVKTSGQKRREAKARAEAEFKAASQRVKEETGYSIGYKKPWAYEQKPKAAYNLWKRVIALFIDFPETLDLGPTALASFLARNEPNYEITRDMMYDKLNDLAVKDLVRLLSKHNITLPLTGNVTIRIVQNLLITRREAKSQASSDEFTGHFRIEGKLAYVNGTPYKIQLGSSKKPRIKHAGAWLSLDLVRSICSR